ncbi:MAG TPA: zinc ribbon domain-containing protein [Anaerolineae bacterium]|nr:zinc ribbon domain-containing protein [Anaerolineae bacterium]HQJ52627.1 zinc ribbon domain-containing protein [Anaerolineae bacterium]
MRCKSCGAQVKPGLGVCSECGATLGHVHVLGHRVRCRCCQKRVPSGVKICPYCGAPLRSTLRNVIRFLVVLLILEVLVYVGKYSVPWNSLRALLGLVRKPEVTFLATPTFTSTRTATITVTSTPTLTRTPTVTPEPPTDTPVPPTVTNTRRPAPTATPKPKFPAPRLRSPDDGTEFRGSDAQIALQWEPVGALAEDEWYAVSVTFTAGGVIQYDGIWTKDSSWLLPAGLYMRAGESERGFNWQVTVMKQTGAKADGGREGTVVSPASTRRTFFWY